MSKKKAKASYGENVRMKPHYDCRRVFPSEQEKDLAGYILVCSKRIMASHPKTADVWRMKWQLSIRFHALQHGQKIRWQGLTGS
jgi:hypothetical protein